MLSIGSVQLLMFAQDPPILNNRLYPVDQNSAGFESPFALIFLLDISLLFLKFLDDPVILVIEDCLRFHFHHQVWIGEDLVY